jgi:hypothetical protein
MKPEQYKQLNVAIKEMMRDINHHMKTDGWDLSYRSEEEDVLAKIVPELFTIQALLFSTITTAGYNIKFEDNKTLISKPRKKKK